MPPFIPSFQLTDKFLLFPIEPIFLYFFSFLFLPLHNLIFFPKRRFQLLLFLQFAHFARPLFLFGLLLGVVLTVRYRA